jgi:hypothetical protein
MRFHWGSIPASPDFAPDEKWRSLKEPMSLWLVQLIVSPIAVVTGVMMVFFWKVLTPVQMFVVPRTTTVFLILACFAALIIVHELVHTAVHPMKGSSPQSFLGFWPSKILFYTHYDGELSRNRFVVILLAPLLVISFAPLLLAALFQWGSGWIAFASILNALMACGDIFGATLLLIQVPASAITRNQGWKTYWKDSPIRTE